MPKFRYTAKRGPQDVIEGVLEAENRSGVLAHLTQLGYMPVRVTEETSSTASAPATRQTPTVRLGRVPIGHLTIFTRQFASLVRSYVPLLRALKLLEDQARHPVLKHVLREVAEEVRQGQTLSSGLAKFPQAFSPLYINLIRSGESSGALEAVLDQLAEQAEQEEALRSKVRMAFTYPIFVGVVGCLTVIFLMTFVMPKLSRLLLGLGSRLPMPTRILLSVTGMMSRGWFWGIVIGGLLLGAVAFKGSGQRGRLALAHGLLRLPMLGPMVRQSEMARFCRSLGLQLTHGIPILQAIYISTQVTGHPVIRAELERLPEGMRQGNALSSCLKELSVGNSFLVNTILVGEESGRVGEALTEVATYYERDTERLVQLIATLLEPTLILFVGVIVGFIVMAVLLPIFEMGALNP